MPIPPNLTLAQVKRAVDRVKWSAKSLEDNNLLRNGAFSQVQWALSEFLSELEKVSDSTRTEVK